MLEFGVATGATITHLANSPSLVGRRIFGFDSFKGLPGAWSGYRAGHFACDPPLVPGNVTLVIGLFANTLPAFLATHPGDAALVHIDCDLYESTKTVLELMTPRIVSGTVIALDEWWIVTDHEQRAWNEWIERTGKKCRHIARSTEQLLVIME